MEELGIAITIIDLISSFFSFALSVATYVLTSWGFYTIAQRRGIDKPWLAWIPVANVWILGCISDQYRYVVKGEVKNKRKWLLGLNIALAVLYIVFCVFFGIVMFDVITGAMDGISEAMIMKDLMGSMVGMLAATLPMLGLAIAVTVIRYIAMYDLYTSCSPQNNVLFLVLSIVFTVTEPFFLFFLRKKDGGMPPRRSAPQQNAYIPPQSDMPRYEAAPEIWENIENE